METSSPEFSPQGDRTPYSAYQFSSETHPNIDALQLSMSYSHIDESPEKMVSSKGEYFTPGISQYFNPTSEEEISPIKPRAVKGKVANKTNQGIEMYAKGLEFLVKKQDNTEKVLRQICPFRPELCSKSVSLLRGSKIVRKPLYEPKTPKAQTVEEAPQDLEKDSVKKLKPDNLLDFLDRNYCKPLQHIKSKRQIIPPGRDAPGIECTFSPRLNQTSMDMASNKGDTQDIYERTKNYNEKVQKWKEEQKKEKDQKLIKDCTFKPKITRRKMHSSQSTLSVLSKSSKDFSKGYAYRYKDLMKHEDITIN